MDRRGSGDLEYRGGGWWRLPDGTNVRGREKAKRVWGEKSGRGPNAEAFAATLAELERMGRLEQVDEAEVEAVRQLAAAVDAKPLEARLWGQYRDALRELTTKDEDVDDRLGAALDRLRGATEVGDAEAAGPGDDRAADS